MFKRLGGLAFPSGFLSSSFLSFSLESCNRVPSLCILHLSCTLLGLLSLGMAMSDLYFLYLARPHPWDVGNVCFTFLLCVIALCMMYVYLYMLVCGWLCTLYDGLSWLRERPFLVMSALDLVVWVCTQGNCCRCIFMLYCMIIAVWLSQSCHLSDLDFPVFVTHINMFNAWRGFDSS